MGGSPSMPAPQPLPPAPQPIDYDRMANASIRVAKAQSAEQEASIKRLYPEYTKLQFQTADQLAGKLDNEYLARTRGVVGEELTSGLGAQCHRGAAPAGCRVGAGPWSVTEPGAATPSNAVGAGGLCGTRHGHRERSGGRGDPQP
jgi:hypothetical protein